MTGKSAPTPTPLVVPIRVEAMPIGAGDLAFKDFAPAYAEFENMVTASEQKPNIGNDILNQPFQGYGPLAQGIHLHWSLPRALRVADFGDGSGAVTVPPAPDRWLVTRIVIDTATADAPTTTLKSWIVESDRISSDDTYSETAVPIPSPTKPYSYLGRKVDLADWDGGSGGSSYLADPITAVGFGIPDFASSYPNCRNVFGMLDDGLNSGNFSTSTQILVYSVTGWYSDLSNDPLASGTAAQASAFGWTYPDPDTFSPSRTFCHGVVFDLPWDANGSFLNDQTSPLGPSVAFGNTPSEAFSAFAAAQLAGDNLKQVEHILNALSLGVLPELAQVGGPQALEEAIYGASYGTRSGGGVWRIHKASKKGNGAEPSADLPEKMKALNIAQAALDAAIEDRSSLQERIFEDWYRYIIVKYATSGSIPDAPSASDTMAYINSEVDDLTALKTSISALTTEVATKSATIAAALPDDLTLDLVVAERYVAPDEPVVMLQGDGVPSALPEDAASISCAFLADDTPTIALPAGVATGSTAITLDVTALPKPSLPDGLPSAAQTSATAAVSLVQLDLATIAKASMVPTAAIGAEGGQHNPATIDFAATASAIAAAQTDFLAGRTPSNGVVFAHVDVPQPDISQNAWSLPWNPIALSWRGDYYPMLPISGVDDSYGATAITGGFAFKPETSLNQVPDSTSFNTSTQLSGTVLLSSDASNSMISQINAYLKHHTDAELETIKTDLGSVAVLAQALSGFNANLMGRVPTLQLPISDPGAEDPISASFSDTTVHDAVGSHNRFAPGFGSGGSGSPVYNALRGGQFVPTKLSFIDSFGRARDVNIGTPAISYTLEDTAVDQGFVLPLRFTQPSRLSATWLSAAQPDIPDCGIPATNPICGWVVVNVLDNSLMFYDAQGHAIGSLVCGANGLVWLVAPDAGPFGQDFTESFTGRNAVLTAFASAVHDAGEDYAEALIETIESTQTFIRPQDHQSSRQTAMLLSAPLALVQASLDFSLLGLPIPDQSYKALKTDIASPDAPMKRTIHGLDDVEIPAVIGDQIDLDDGLVGYFLAPSGGTADFGTCYAPAATGSDSKVKVPSPSQITLSLAQSEPTLIAMLVDPRAGVHVNTGLHPVRKLTLAPETYTGALSAMTFSFLTAPVLAPAGAFSTPAPSEGTGSWEWVTFRDNGWQTTAFTKSTQGVTLQRPQSLQDGWLRYKPEGGS